MKGSEAFTKPGREKSEGIIAESGADTEEHFNKVQAVNLGITLNVNRLSGLLKWKAQTMQASHSLQLEKLSA